MRTNIPEKLLAISDEIVARGHANLTRLTVLKPWFERPNRLRAFANWVAARAKSRKGKTGGVAGELFKEAQVLLGRVQPYAPELDRGLLSSFMIVCNDSRTNTKTSNGVQCGLSRIGT